MTLRQARVMFTMLAARLIIEATAKGYEVAAGEVVRDARVAALNAKTGSGVANSLHLSGLAIDLIAYRNGKYLDRTEDYTALGEWWEQQHQNCRWGGRFGRADGNHFSFTLWEGRA